MEVLEVGLESMAATVGLTEILKNVVRRERPNNNSGRGGRDRPSKKSFPSGHVSVAAVGASVTGRWLRSRDERLVVVELLLYTGVVYTGITRIENDKHFPSDVAAGAILGMYMGNTIWDAHFGREEKPGIFDYLREHLRPLPIEDGVAVGWVIDF